MIVLDAGVLIAHLDERDAHHERARRLLTDTAGEQLGVSTISLAETLVAPARAGRLADATTAIERLDVQELRTAEGAAGLLAQLRAETGRKLPDCCVLLAAAELRGTVASFDAALVAAARDQGLTTLD